MISETQISNRKTCLVSIVMPIYNRQKFLSGAINSIKSQLHENWELIVVDDGSEDDSLSLIEELTKNLGKHVLIISQENSGPAAARNAGISNAKGEYVAFFDSDDIWKQHHLSNCLAAFLENPDLDWVYGACERVNYFTNECLQKSTFYQDNKGNELFDVVEIIRDKVHILEQTKAITLQLTKGIDNGLQNSLVKSDIFDNLSIPNFRVGEDRLFIIMVLKSGYKMAFIDDVHVRYHIHDENISDTNAQASFNQRISSLEKLIFAKQHLKDYVSLNEEENKAYSEQLSKEIFWELGYSLYQASGDYKKAIGAYLEAIKLSGLNKKYCKTLLLALPQMLIRSIKPK